jgi:hypothetical protein
MAPNVAEAREWIGLAVLGALATLIILVVIFGL